MLTFNAFYRQFHVRRLKTLILTIKVGKCKCHKLKLYCIDKTFGFFQSRIFKVFGGTLFAQTVTAKTASNKNFCMINQCKIERLNKKN